MTFDADCEFPALLKARDPGVWSLLLTAQTVTEQVGGNFRPEEFGVCEYEDQAPTLVRLQKRSFIGCCKHAKTIVRLSPDDNSSRPAANKHAKTMPAGRSSILRSKGEPVEGERASPEERDLEAYIQRMVRAAHDTVINSPEFRRVVEDHALIQHQLAMTRNSEISGGFSLLSPQAASPRVLLLTPQALSPQASLQSPQALYPRAFPLSPQSLSTRVFPLSPEAPSRAPLSPQAPLLSPQDDHGTGAAPAADPAASPEEQAHEALVRRLVIAAMHEVDNSPMFKRLVAEHALKQHESPRVLLLSPQALSPQASLQSPQALYPRVPPLFSQSLSTRVPPLSKTLSPRDTPTGLIPPLFSQSLSTRVPPLSKTLSPRDTPTGLKGSDPHNDPLLKLSEQERIHPSEDRHMRRDEQKHLTLGTAHAPGRPTAGKFNFGFGFGSDSSDSDSNFSQPSQKPVNSLETETEIKISSYGKFTLKDTMQTLPVLCGRKNSLSWRSPLSGDLSDASMVLNRPSDDASAIRPMLSLYPATTKGATVTAAHNAAQSVEDEVAGHEVTGGNNTMQPGTRKADELVDALREPSVESHLSGGLLSDSMICHPPDTASVIRSGPTLYPCTAKDAGVANKLTDVRPWSEVVTDSSVRECRPNHAKLVVEEGARRHVSSAFQFGDRPLGIQFGEAGAVNGSRKEQKLLAEGTSMTSVASLVPAINTDSNSQTAEAIRGDSALATTTEAIVEAKAVEVNSIVEYAILEYAMGSLTTCTCVQPGRPFCDTWSLTTQPASAVGSLPMQPAGPSRENLTQQPNCAMSSPTMQPASSVCVFCSLTMEPASAMGTLTMQPARPFRENLIQQPASAMGSLTMQPVSPPCVTMQYASSACESRTTCTGPARARVSLTTQPASPFRDCLITQPTNTMGSLTTCTYVQATRPFRENLTTQPVSAMVSLAMQPVSPPCVTMQLPARAMSSLTRQPTNAMGSRTLQHAGWYTRQPSNERPACAIENAAHRQIWNSFHFGDKPFGMPTTVGGNNKRPSVVASVIAQVVAAATAASATDKGSPADLKPSDQQALAEVLNVDAVSLLASIAASVVPVAVVSAVAQAVAARADAPQADVSQVDVSQAAHAADTVATTTDEGSQADRKPASNAPSPAINTPSVEVAAEAPSVEGVSPFASATNSAHVGFVQALAARVTVAHSTVVDHGVSPSDQQALSEALNVDGVLFLASIAASVVPVAVAPAVAH